MINLIAQIPDAGVPIYRVFVEFGFAGVMLYWLTMRMEARLDIMANKMEENTWANAMMAKTQLITLIALGQLDSPVKHQAEGVLREISQKYPDQSPMPERYKK